MDNTLQREGFLRLPQVLKLIPVCPATWWAGCGTGRFPKPVKIGTRITVWRAADIADFIEKTNAQEDVAEASGGQP
jgi:predicted DNA-binding transcriptional regulator AlpA